jgi:hypothetical protein
VSGLRDGTSPTDPPVRADGRCHVCKGPRGKIPKTLVKRTARDLAAALAADPFCSSACARRFYGCPLPDVTGHGNGRKLGPLMHGTEYGYTKGCRCDACRTGARVERAKRRERKSSGGVDMHDSPAAAPGELSEALKVA